MEFSTEGKHILADVWGIDFYTLENIQEIKKHMIDGAKKCGANVLSVQEKQFEPYGLTVLLLLSESHFSIHTYPEKGFAGIDCYTCGPNVKPEVAINHLIDYLQPTKSNIKMVSRGVEEDIFTKE